jgi:N4-gp56 family major capsid protein
MANVFTDTTALSNAVQTAYDKSFRFALRAHPMFRQLADVHPTDLTAPGSSMVLSTWADLAPATTPLTETTDPDAVALGNPSQKTLTINEYGNPVIRTRKLMLVSITDVDPAAASMIAYNMADSVDVLVQTQIRGGSNLLQIKNGTMTYVTNATVSTAATTMVSTVTSGVATDGITSRAVRLSVAKLRTNKAVPKRDSNYGGMIHPEVSHDLRQETGAASWREPHNYSAAGNIWFGEIGLYEGVYWIESPRCYQALDAGSGDNSVRRFRTYIAGQEALAEAIADEFHVVAGPITDKLGRFRPLGWLGTGGWARFREEALVRIETTSSIDAT